MYIIHITAIGYVQYTSMYNTHPFHSSSKIWFQ